MTSEPTREQLIAKWEREAERMERVAREAQAHAYLSAHHKSELAGSAAEARLIASALKDAARYAELRSALIGEQWQQACEIKQDADGRWMVRFGYWFLRQSHGPETGTFWDSYGDDFQSEAWAVIAVSNAPTPRSLQSRAAIDAATRTAEGDAKHE